MVHVGGEQQRWSRFRDHQSGLIGRRHGKQPGTKTGQQANADNSGSAPRRRFWRIGSVCVVVGVACHGHSLPWNRPVGRETANHTAHENLRERQFGVWKTGSGLSSELARVWRFFSLSSKVWRLRLPQDQDLTKHQASNSPGSRAEIDRRSLSVGWSNCSISACNATRPPVRTVDPYLVSPTMDRPREESCTRIW